MKHASRKITGTRGGNFVGEIFSLAAVSPLRSSDCNFYRSPGSIRIPFSVSTTLDLSAICIPMSHIDVSDCRLTYSFFLLLLSFSSFFFLFFLFFLSFSCFSPRIFSHVSPISRRVDVDNAGCAQVPSRYYCLATEW